MQAKLSGNLYAGPAEGVSGGFDSMTLNEQLSFQPSGDQGIGFQVGDGVLTVNVATNSPSWRTLHGVGPGETVTQGILFYAKSSGALLLRLTFDDGVGGSIVSIFPISGGPILMPLDATKFLKLLEVQGQGRLIYFVCGNV